MILVRVNLALRRENVKGGDPQIIHIANRPAISTVSLDVLIDAAETLLKLLEQVTAAISCGFFTEGANSRGKRFLRGGAGRRILMPQQVLCFAGPRHNLRIKTAPGR